MKWPQVGVGAVALREGSLLLILRGQEPSKGRWSLPGGRLEWGETLSAALGREVREETGLDVEVGPLAGMVERIYPDFHYVILDYFATVTGGQLQPGGDVTDARWVPLGQVANLPAADRLLEALRDFGVAV